MTNDTSVGDFIGEAIAGPDDLIRRLKEGRPPSEVNPLARDLWNRDGFAAAAEIERLRERAKVLDLIDQLREPEGDSVSLVCDNPDFNGLPNCCVIVNGGWTGYYDVEFRCDTLVACLEAAVASAAGTRP